MRRLRRFACGLALAALVLQGCSSDDKQMKVCPRVAVLSEAGTMTRFQPGPGRDILDIDFQGDIGDIIASCEYPDAKGGARRVTVQVAPVFVFSRGAANREAVIDFTYFVSVVRNEEILSKQQFEVQTQFAANRARVIVRDDNPPISIDIPLPYKAAEYEYEVLLGFQLSAEDLDYNRRWQGLGR
ncbi:MAG TPA: hypothetical protein VES39_07655 [Rhodospirillales bacterium]|nr:hypothetical protein [Rhodospirillales bacterium]